MCDNFLYFMVELQYFWNKNTAGLRLLLQSDAGGGGEEGGGDKD